MLVNRRAFVGVPWMLWTLQGVYQKPAHVPGGLAALPIRGITIRELRDSFDEQRGTSRHEAIDIAAPRGTPVYAVVSGTVRKLFLSKPGGNTIYLFGDDEVYCYYYAHLDAYRPDLREGMRVKAGDLLAYVGSSGNASPEAPHLHMAIVELLPTKEWWKGTYVNPYPLLVSAVRRLS